jgi:hypothetical protein
MKSTPLQSTLLFTLYSSPLPPPRIPVLSTPSFTSLFFSSIYHTQANLFPIPLLYTLSSSRLPYSLTSPLLSPLLSPLHSTRHFIPSISTLSHFSSLHPILLVISSHSFSSFRYMLHYIFFFLT